MAKRNKKGGWTGTAAGSNAVKSGGGPQVERTRSELKKFEMKSTASERIGRLVLFVLGCILAGSLIFQATPKNMAEYWGLDDVSEQISKVEIVRYNDASGESRMVTLADPADVDEFCRVVDETKLKRLWFADKESVAFTETIAVYADDAEAPAFEMGLADNRVYFIGMPTYDWYLQNDAPLMEYIG